MTRNLYSNEDPGRRLRSRPSREKKMNRLRTIMASLMLSAAAAPLSVLAQPPHGGPQGGEHGHDRGGHHGVQGHGRPHNGQPQAGGSPGRSAYAPGHWRKGDRLPAEYRAPSTLSTTGAPTILPRPRRVTDGSALVTSTSWSSRRPDWSSRWVHESSRPSPPWSHSVIGVKTPPGDRHRPPAPHA